MARLLLWVLMGLSLSLSEAELRERETEATPFPPPREQGLFTVMQDLVQKVADITSRQARDR